MNRNLLARAAALLLEEAERHRETQPARHAELTNVAGKIDRLIAVSARDKNARTGKGRES